MAQPPSTRTDEDLFSDYRRGHSQALRTLIERHQEELLRFLYRLTGDRASAEDVFQETFLQIHQSAGTFDTSRRFRPWLFTIAANKARDMLRRKGRRPTLDLSAPVAGSSSDAEGGGGTSFIDLMEIDVPSPNAALDSEERDAMVQKAIGTLSPTLREILLMAYFQRLSYVQIAEDLEIPLGTVKSRLHAAVAGFARSWQRLNEHSQG